jgi:hypothetical protein
MRTWVYSLRQQILAQVTGEVVQVIVVVAVVGQMVIKVEIVTKQVVQERLTVVVAENAN